MSQPSSVPLEMDRPSFRSWAEQQMHGRWERHGGVVVAMAPERSGHALLKARVWQALDGAIRAAGLDCVAYPDGMTVCVEDHSDYEPDAVVNCGPALDSNDTAVPRPVIVVEVLSPSTAATDMSRKLADYFRVASVEHYLLFSVETMRVIHHRRGTGTALLTTISTGGDLVLDPPGLSMPVEALYRPG